MATIRRPLSPMSHDVLCVDNLHVRGLTAVHIGKSSPIKLTTVRTVCTYSTVRRTKYTTPFILHYQNRTTVVRYCTEVSTWRACYYRYCMIWPDRWQVCFLVFVLSSPNKRKVDVASCCFH